MARNKVIYGNHVIMDITDTTAEATDVAAGEVFYDRGGNRTVGTGNYMNKVSDPTANDILITDANGQAIDSGVDINDVAMSVDLPGQATDIILGLIKTNANKSIFLNENGQLEVGGRIGQFPGTTGLFAPDDREPRNVGNYCLMITDVKGAQMTNSRSFAVMSGLSITLKTAAAAGATEYHVSNTYANRLKCKICEGGFAAKDEATSAAEQVIPVVSVTIGGQAYTPDSAPDDPTQDIIITTESTLNPDDAITGIRAVGTMGSYSTAHIGNGISSVGGGRCLLLGSGITKDGAGNECGVVAQDTYVMSNGSGVFGRWHIVNKNRAFIAGQGHDTTNARADGAAAIGAYSLMDEKTVLAVGLGASHIARKNAFEVTADHGGTSKVNFVDAKNAKIEVSGTEDILPAVAAGYWTIGNGGSIVDYEGTPGFATTDVKGTAVNITVAAGFAMPVTAGETITWSFTARKRTGSETGKLQLNLLKCNATGGGTSNNVVKDGTAASYSTEWTTYTGTFVVPGGMEFILPRMSRTNTGAGSSGGYDIKDLTITRQVDSGIILTAPNGSKWKLQVANDGTLSTAAVT